MQRPELWKVLTVGLALAGLGFVGAGAAFADGRRAPGDHQGRDGYQDRRAHTVKPACGESPVGET